MTLACARKIRAARPWKFATVTRSRMAAAGTCRCRRSRMLSRARLEKVVTSALRGQGI